MRILDWVTISFSRDLPDPGTEPASGVIAFPERGGIRRKYGVNGLIGGGVRKNRYRYG